MNESLDFLNGTITKIVIETDEKDPKTIAVITNNGTDELADGYRVRYTPKYD